MKSSNTVKILLGVAVILGIWLFLQPRHVNPPILGIILFEGSKCEKCDKVEAFIKNNKVEKKVSFTRLEVFNNDANANLLADKAQTCGLDSAQIGVPFLWDGANCIVGYIDVINFFKQKISQK